MSASISTSAHISDWKVVKGSLVVGAGLLTGQALGFIRHATVAYLLGTGPSADALAVAFVPVDFLWSILSTAVVFGFGPMFAGAAQNAGAVRFRGLALALARYAVLFSGVGLLLAWPAVRILGPGLSSSTAGSAVLLFRITILAIPALAGSALFTALLYGERRFTVAAFHQSVVNVFTIVWALEFHRHFGPAAVAVGYVTGAWFQCGLMWWHTRPILSGYGRGRYETADSGSGPAPLIGRLVPVLSYAILVNLNAVVTRAFASTFGVGAVAGFDYSLRLLNVPLALLVVPLSSSLLSEIASCRGDRAGVAYRAMRRMALLTGLAAAAVAFAMSAGASWFVALLFERGSFSSLSTATVSAILTGFAPSLLAWSALELLSRSFFALGKPNAPIVAAGVALLVNAGGCSELPIREVSGIGVPAVLGFFAAALIVAFHLRRLRMETEARAGAA